MLVNVNLSNSKKLFGFLFIKFGYNSNKKNIIVKIKSQEGYWLLVNIRLYVGVISKVKKLFFWMLK